MRLGRIHKSAMGRRLHARCRSKRSVSGSQRHNVIGSRDSRTRGWAMARFGDSDSSSREPATVWISTRPPSNRVGRDDRRRGLVRRVTEQVVSAKVKQIYLIDLAGASEVGGISGEA